MGPYAGIMFKHILKLLLQLDLHASIPWTGMWVQSAWIYAYDTLPGILACGPRPRAQKKAPGAAGGGRGGGMPFGKAP